jgi:hypothetical protein
MSATRVWWEELRTRLDQESRAMKQSQEAVLAHEQAYRALSDDEKQAKAIHIDNLRSALQ